MYQPIYLRGANGTCTCAGTARNARTGAVYQMSPEQLATMPAVATISNARTNGAYVMEPGQYAAIVQSGNVAPAPPIGLANNQSGPGEVSAFRNEEVGASTNFVSEMYTINLANGTGTSQTVFGDKPGTAALSNLVTNAPGTVVITGTFGANSLSQLTDRASFRPFRVTTLYVTNSNPASYAGNLVQMFDTTPAGAGNKKQLVLLRPQPQDLNNGIQSIELNAVFDGTNGLFFTIPPNTTLNLQFSIVAEKQVNSLVRL